MCAPLSTKFMQDLFSDHELPLQSREVRSLGGGLVKIKGPIILTVEVCSLILQHPFYYYDGNTTFLMGYDLISAAALTIDSESRCVWSKPMCLVETHTSLSHKSRSH